MKEQKKHRFRNDGIMLVALIVGFPLVTLAKFLSLSSSG
jgi:hypothetical protein